MIPVFESAVKKLKQPATYNELMLALKTDLVALQPLASFTSQVLALPPTHDPQEFKSALVADLTALQAASGVSMRILSMTGEEAPSAFMQALQYDMFDLQNEGYPTDQFVMEVLRNSTTEPFSIEINPISPISITIDWGDGTISPLITTHTDPELSHIYSTVGAPAEVSITGTMGAFEYRVNPISAARIYRVLNFGRINMGNLNGAFLDCVNLVEQKSVSSSVVGGLNIIKIFSGCRSLVSCDLEGFYKTSVHANWGAFEGCTSLSQINGLERIFSHSTTALARTFFNCSALPKIPDLGNVNMAACRNLIGAFANTRGRGINFLHKWDVSKVVYAVNFMNGTAMLTKEYDKTLIAWAKLPLQSGVNCHFGSSKYSLGGEAEAARTKIVNQFGWIIIDGGGI